MFESEIRGEEKGYKKDWSEGSEKGRAEGCAESIAEGENNAKLSIARSLKSLGTMTSAQIAAATDLTESEIATL